MERYHGRPFDNNPCHLLGAIFPFFGCMSLAGCFKSVQERAFFCSEFIAFLYQKLGLLPADINPQHVSPQVRGNACSVGSRERQVIGRL